MAALDDCFPWMQTIKSETFTTLTIQIICTVPDLWNPALLNSLMRVNGSYWEYVLANHVEIAALELAASNIDQLM